ncbi:MAG: ABC transporter substrate-binding protein [Rhodospirillales bacterium]
MTKITLACWDYDRAMPVLDGHIKVKGFDLDCHAEPPGTLFPLAVGDAPYDVTEFSFASYLIQLSRGECQYIGVPVYLSRAFRHGAIYVRSDSGIKEAKDLEGRVVGVPEYAMTLAVWVRGILADDYGVDVSTLKYRTGGLNEPGRIERLKLDIPDHIDIQPMGPTVSLNDAILDGQLDAIIAPAPPRAFSDGDPRVLRLIDPAGPAERDYFARTKIFPPMHILGIKKTVAAAHPTLPGALYDAFLDARRIAMDRVKAVAQSSANREMSPWYAEAYEQAVSIMGPDYWSYGVDDNIRDLEAFCRYCDAQHLTARLVFPDELFHPDTISKPGR